MSIAKEVGIPVPDFYLSEDGKRYVARRFDRSAGGIAIGFEDIAALLGLNSDSKYKLSYETAAFALRFYCSKQHKSAALAQLFDQVSLSCLAGNDDAHLKNFGVIYEDPAEEQIRVSPANDIVCTTCYIPEDVLALTLNGQRGLMAARADLEKFGGSTCGVAHPLGRIATLIEAMHVIMFTQSERIDQVPGLRQCFEPSLARFEQLAAEHAPCSLL